MSKQTSTLTLTQTDPLFEKSCLRLCGWQCCSKTMPSRIPFKSYAMLFLVHIAAATAIRFILCRCVRRSFVFARNLERWHFGNSCSMSDAYSNDFIPEAMAERKIKHSLFDVRFLSTIKVLSSFFNLFIYCHTLIIFTIHIHTLITILKQLLLIYLQYFINSHYITIQCVYSCILPKLHYSQYNSKNVVSEHIENRLEIKVRYRAHAQIPRLIEYVISF